MFPTEFTELPLLQETASSITPSVSTDDIEKYIGANLQRNKNLLRNNKDNPDVHRLIGNAEYYLESIKSGLPEDAILLVHEKAEVAALRTLGEDNHALFSTLAEFNVENHRSAHKSAIEAEKVFINRLKSVLKTDIPMEYLLIGYPFYVNDLTRENGGTAFSDRVKILFEGSKPDPVILQNAITFYKSVGMKYEK